MKHNRFERGQSLVLIVLAIVGMLGFAALAVDGGRVMAERRRAQSAADSAALAAAFANSESGSKNPSASAKTSLETNGFEDDLSLADDVEVNNPPITGPYSLVTNKNEYYQVKIHKVVDKVFSQFIFPGNLEYRVEAVSHLQPPQGIAPGMGIVASGENTCHGIVWNGSIITTVYHGSIFSNSSGVGNNCSSGLVSGNTKPDGTLEDAGKINTPDGEILMAGNFENNGNALLTSSTGTNQVRTIDHMIFPSYPDPYCDGLAWTVENTTTHNLPAGRHSAIDLKVDEPWTMAAGMHCFYGDFSVHANSTGTLTGDGVFIAMMAGNISFPSGTTFDLRAASSLLDGRISPEPTQWGGFLIYMPPSNESGIDISGNTGTSFSGTIYAPSPRTGPGAGNKPKCNIGGTNQTSNLELNTSIICYDIGISGNTTIRINYDEETNARGRPFLDLTQ